jgi:hypothetical protein
VPCPDPNASPNTFKLKIKVIKIFVTKTKIRHKKMEKQPILIPQTMKALVLEKFGAPPKYSEVPVPRPGP